MSVKKILIVDDEKTNRKLILTMLSKQNYVFESAEDGNEALKKLEDFTPDIILLDVMMPGIDGIEVCRRLKKDPLTERIPIIILTALTDKETVIKGLNAGANDFLAKPIYSEELILRVGNLLKVKDHEDFIEQFNISLGIKIEEKTGELKESFLDTIRRLCIATEFKDNETGKHIRRVTSYTRHMVHELGYSDEEAEVMFYASALHDIGKIGIPDSVLLKPSSLTKEEFEIMKTHTIIGDKILRLPKSAILKSAQKFALCHHERWNGDGYPQGLKGEKIPIEGRIFNLIDQYDALRNKRPYKPPLSHDEVFEIITKGDGRTLPEHFDPKVLRVFKDTHKKFEEIFNANMDNGTEDKIIFDPYSNEEIM